MEIMRSSPNSAVVIKLDFISPTDGHNTWLRKEFERGLANLKSGTATQPVPNCG
jgi:hypothetical protein